MSVFHGGDVWQGLAPGDYLDFSANLNPEGPPRWVREAMIGGFENARYYPDLRQTAALKGAGAFLGLPEECLLLTGGGIEAVALAADLPVAENLSRVAMHIIAQPTFQEYAHFCRPCRDIRRHEMDACAPAAGECLWVCNPNNPTGDAIFRQDMLALLARVEAAGGRLVVDEAFIDYCPENSVRDAVMDHPALVVLGSLTKTLAIPGVRLGWMAAHPSVIALARDRQLPWRLNCLADAVAAALPGHEAEFDQLRALNAQRRERFAADLAGIGARVYPSQANFLLCDFGRDMRPVIETLREERILVRPCGMFPGLTHGHVRLCVRSEGENDILVGAVARELG